jgi:tetratricopeptide (TPR) repeat protein
MYLPFVGLALSATWATALLIETIGKRTNPTIVHRTAAAVALILLTAYAYGVRQRNKVWHTEETLWLDDVLKSPHNGRGLMNYGLTQMEKGNYTVALDYFQRALVFTPNYPTLEINLGVVNGAVNNHTQAEQHFLSAISLAPSDYQTHFYYGRWLFQAGRTVQAIQQLESATWLNPLHLESRDLLTQARLSLSHAAPPQSADYWINISLAEYQNKNYQASIEASHQALQLNPNSELAYNNLGAAYAALEQWDLAIRNDQQALRLKPDFQLAKNNLAWAFSQKAQNSAHESSPRSGNTNVR